MRTLFVPTNNFTFPIMVRRKSLRTLQVPGLAQPIQQMQDRQDRVVQEHARAGVAPNAADLRALRGVVRPAVQGDHLADGVGFALEAGRL